MVKDLNLPLPSVDDLFSTQEQRDEAKLEKVRDIPIDEIDGFPGHPFKVKDDEGMVELANSIKAYGVQTPVTVRKKDDGRYELVSGHRRKRACEIAGISTIPTIIRDMSRDEAILFMVDSNLQRERILPSEKAFSYKMKLEAMRRQAGRPSNNYVPLGHNFDGKSSREVLAGNSPDSNTQIQRYIRLTELIPSIMDMVDEGRIAFRPAVELSYLPAEKQNFLYETMDVNESTPSLAQAIKMKQFHQNNLLTDEVVLSIMDEEKPNQIEQFKMPKNRIERFFPAGTKKKEAEDIIVKALEQYFSREKGMPESPERKRDDWERER